MLSLEYILLDIETHIYGNCNRVEDVIISHKCDTDILVKSH